MKNDTGPCQSSAAPAGHGELPAGDTATCATLRRFGKRLWKKLVPFGEGGQTVVSLSPGPPQRAMGDGPGKLKKCKRCETHQQLFTSTTSKAPLHQS